MSKNTIRMRFGTLTALIAVLGLMPLQASAQANPPEFLQGHKLKKPLAETRIGMTVLYPGSNAYQAKYAEEATRYAKELGIQAQVLDPQGDPAKQVSQVQDLIAQQVDVIVLWPTSETALVPAIRQAYAAKIPLDTSNSEVAKDAQKYVTAHTGPDDCTQASQTAEMLGDGIGAKGNIVIVEGTPGYTVSRLRKECFLKTLGEKYPNVKILDSQPANWSRERAQSVTEAYLTKYGKAINAVYAFDDGMGAGVINALQAAGYKPGEVQVFTCNLFREGYDFIKAGWETGSNKQSPIDDADLAIQTAIMVAQGIEVPKKKSIPTPKITKANLTEFPIPTW